MVSDILPGKGDIIRFKGELWCVQHVNAAGKCRLQRVQTEEGGRVFKPYGEPIWFGPGVLAEHGWALHQAFEYQSQGGHNETSAGQG